MSGVSDTLPHKTWRGFSIKQRYLILLILLDFSLFRMGYDSKSYSHIALMKFDIININYI